MHANRLNMQGGKYGVLIFVLCVAIAAAAAAADAANPGGSDNDVNLTTTSKLLTDFSGGGGTAYGGGQGGGFSLLDPLGVGRNTRDLVHAAIRFPRPKDYIQSFMRISLEHFRGAMNNMAEMAKEADDSLNKMAVDDCKELLNYAIDELQESMSSVSDCPLQFLMQRLVDLKNWLSAVLTFSTTCMDGFTKPHLQSSIHNFLRLSNWQAAQALSVVSAIPQILSGLNIHANPSVSSGGANMVGNANPWFPSGGGSNMPGNARTSSSSSGGANMVGNANPSFSSGGGENMQAGNARTSSSFSGGANMVGNANPSFSSGGGANMAGNANPSSSSGGGANMAGNANPSSSSGGGANMAGNANPSSSSGGGANMAGNANPSSSSGGGANMAGNVNPSSSSGGGANMAGNANPSSSSGNENMVGGNADASSSSTGAVGGNGPRFPGWMPKADRKLLMSRQGGGPGGGGGNVNLQPNAVVAKDGSGQYSTITEALNAYKPKKNQPTTRHVIYVKAGVYDEYIIITKKQTNIFMYGDGPRKTIVTGRKCYRDGVSTFRTAPFAVVGNGFICKSMGFENTAGPEGHQAVALRVQSDMSAFYNCRMDGYQDTLYTHAHRQFYSNCVITGTVDFIFGDAAAIIQDSTIIVRKPMDNQKNIVTAHGRTHFAEMTGLVIQNCQIIAEDALNAKKTEIASYLGRPWKPYSRTVIMESTIGDFIRPEGWMPWAGTIGLDTCYYAEYGNRGPAADTSRRVNWRGYHVLTNPNEAMKFTVEQFIQGNQWLPATGAPYFLGLKGARQ